MEGKTNFSRSMKQFDGLTGLTLTPIFYASIILCYVFVVFVLV